MPTNFTTQCQKKDMWSQKSVLNYFWAKSGVRKYSQWQKLKQYFFSKINFSILWNFFVCLVNVLMSPNTKLFWVVQLLKVFWELVTNNLYNPGTWDISFGVPSQNRFVPIFRSCPQPSDSAFGFGHVLLIELAYIIIS